MVMVLSSMVTMTITALNLASVWQMDSVQYYYYSKEQLRRKAHLENGGTLANYDRTHYPQKDEVENEDNDN